MTMVSAVTSIISTISDDNVISLFKAIALSESDDNSATIITKLRLTRKQYYSRMEKLIHAGLIKRVSGKYSLSSLGKIIFDIYGKIESAINYYWNLKAVDSILISANAELPAEECQRIIDKLIDDKEIKDILVSNNKQVLFSQRSDANAGEPIDDDSKDTFNLQA